MSYPPKNQISWPVHVIFKSDKLDYLRSPRREKKDCFVFSIGQGTRPLESEIGAGSGFFHSVSFSDRVGCVLRRDWGNTFFRKMSTNSKILSWFGSMIYQLNEFQIMTKDHERWLVFECFLNFFLFGRQTNKFDLLNFFLYLFFMRNVSDFYINNLLWTVLFLTIMFATVSN